MAHPVGAARWLRRDQRRAQAWRAVPLEGELSSVRRSPIKKRALVPKRTSASRASSAQCGGVPRRFRAATRRQRRPSPGARSPKGRGRQGGKRAASEHQSRSQLSAPNRRPGWGPILSRIEQCFPKALVGRSHRLGGAGARRHDPSNSRRDVEKVLETAAVGAQLKSAGSFEFWRRRGQRATRP